MPFSLSRSHVIVLGGLAAVALLGVVLTVSVGTSVGVVALLLLQVLVLAALVVIRSQMVRTQRQMRGDMSAAMAGEVARLRAAVDEVSAAAPINQVLEIVGRDRVDTAALIAKIREVNAALAGDVHGLQERLVQLTRETKLGFLQVTTDAWWLHNLVGVVDVPGHFPAPGGWAVTPATLVELVTLVQSDRRDLLVVECGSGASTVWIAHCQRTKGGRGRVVALEHDPEFADKTRAELHRLGLDNWAEVRDAPLVDVDINGRTTLWYDPKALADLRDIDLLLVDGPPWRTAEEARYPAMTMFASALARGARVVLDDVNREPERSIAERWAHEEAAGIRLVPERRTDRAQVFRVEPSDGVSPPDLGVGDGPSGHPYDAADADPV